MKKITLSRLTADPLTKARASEGSGETITISGYVRSTDDDTISICEKQSSKTYVEYPRSSIVAAFEEDNKSTKVTFLIRSDAEVRTIRPGKAKDAVKKNGCGCGGSDTGVKEARPLKSIHPALAAFAKEMARLRSQAGGKSADLKCAEARTECFINGGTTEECDAAFDECLFNEMFGLQSAI